MYFTERGRVTLYEQYKKTFIESGKITFLFSCH